MRSLKLFTFTALMGLSVAVFSGCSTAQKGAAAGGLLGGATGAVVGNNVGTAGPATGIVVGGTTGVAVGGLSGDAYDQVTEADTERELENLRAELDAKEAELAALRSATPSDQQLAEAEAMRGRIGELESQIAGLQDQLALATARADEESAARAALEASKAELDNNLSMTRSLADKEAADRAALQAELDALRAQKDARISDLEGQLADKSGRLNALEGEVQALQTSLTGKQAEFEGLKSELEKMNIKLEETNRGLTMTIVNSLLYTPGSSELSDSGKKLLGDVARILNEKFPNRELLIEGHTDNQPIVHSGWRSNWELGAARSLTILHELVDQHKIDPARVSATTYGEFRPSTPNGTDEGRSANRRAVIVILPEKLPVQRESLAQAN